MPMQTFAARVARLRDLTSDVRELELALVDPPAIHFAPGQFVSFKVERQGLRFPLTRAYSIASPPSRRHAITLVFNLVPGGPGSSYLYGLRAEDEVTFRGPAGTFVLHEYPERDLLLVATGTGIAPFMSMIPARLAAHPERRLTLLWGLRHEHDLYFQEELAGWMDRYATFTAVTTLSRPADGWRGETGRVTRLVEERVDSVDSLAVYLCGNSGMLTDVTTALRRKGLCPIHREQYYLD